MARVNTDIQAIGAGANLDVQPAAGNVYEITALGSSAAFAGVPPAAVPDVSAGIFTGVLGPAHIVRSTDVRGWYRRFHWLINNTFYLRITNDAIALANLSYSGRIWQVYGTGAGASNCRTTVQQLAGGGAYVMQPVAGEEYIVRDFGSTLWVGAGPAGLPDMLVQMTDAAGNIATMLDGATPRQWEPELEIHIDNTNYLTITNQNVAQADVCIVAERSRSYGQAATNNRSDVANCVGGANLDFQPVAGEEWRVNGFGAAAWVGVPPAQFPDMTVSLFDGALASVIANQTDWLCHGHLMDVHVGRGHYIRLTDTSGVAQDLCLSAILSERFA